MPGAVPMTSTLALTNVTFPFVKNIANIGWKEMVKNDKGFAQGISISGGELLDEDVSKAFGIK